MTTPASGARAVGLAPALTRWAGFLCIWLVILPSDVPALVVGALTAAAAAWTSLRLLPPGGRLRPLPIAGLVLRFFAQSAVAGADVARRALDPALPLCPGFALCPTRLAPGPARDAFCAIASLLPGTLPAGADPSGALLVHCLDAGQDVAAQMAEEETMFVAAFGGTAGHG